MARVEFGNSQKDYGCGNKPKSTVSVSGVSRKCTDSGGMECQLRPTGWQFFGDITKAKHQHQWRLTG